MTFHHLKPESFLDEYQEHFPIIKKFVESLLAEIELNNYEKTTIPPDEWTNHLFIKKGQKLIKEALVRRGFERNEENFKKLLKTAEAANTKLNLLNRLIQNFERILIIMEMVTPYHPLWIELEQKLRCKMDIRGTQVCKAVAKQMQFLDAEKQLRKEIEAWEEEATQFFDFPERALLAIKKARDAKLI